MSNSTYALIATFSNVVDGTPQFQAITPTVISVNGFTATWNASLDSANYVINYMVIPTQSSSTAQSGTVALGSGVNSAVVPFSTSMADTSFSVLAILANVTDVSPQFQDVTVTAIATTGFTGTWNAATDSANYILHYIAFENASSGSGAVVSSGTVGYVTKFSDSATIDNSYIFQGRISSTVVNGTAQGNAFTIFASADAAITGTTTLNASTALTMTGTGHNLLTDLGVGDEVALSSAPTVFSPVVSIASDSQAILNSALGNNTSQTVTRRQAQFRTADRSGLTNFFIDPYGKSVFSYDGYHVPVDRVSIFTDLQTVNAPSNLIFAIDYTGSGYTVSEGSVITYSLYSQKVIHGQNTYSEVATSNSFTENFTPTAGAATITYDPSGNFIAADITTDYTIYGIYNSKGQPTATNSIQVTDDNSGNPYFITISWTDPATVPDSILVINNTTNQQFVVVTGAQTQVDNNDGGAVSVPAALSFNFNLTWTGAASIDSYKLLNSQQGTSIDAISSGATSLVDNNSAWAGDTTVTPVQYFINALNATGPTVLNSSSYDANTLNLTSRAGYNSIYADSGAFYVDNSGNIFSTGGVNAGGSTFNGNTNISGVLGVTGAITSGGLLTMHGFYSSTGNGYLAGNLMLDGGSLNIQGSGTIQFNTIPAFFGITATGTSTGTSNTSFSNFTDIGSGNFSKSFTIEGTFDGRVVVAGVVTKHVYIKRVSMWSTSNLGGVTLESSQVVYSDKTADPTWDADFNNPLGGGINWLAHGNTGVAETVKWTASFFVTRNLV